jgi:Tol biopolymer transport system component
VDIFAIASDGGEAINLTNTPEIREENPRWSPDGKTVAMNHKPKEATVYNIALMDWATRKVTLLTHENTPNHLWQSVAWSPDGKTLYADRLEVSFTDSDIYALDVDSGRTTNLTTHEARPSTARLLFPATARRC